MAIHQKQFNSLWANNTKYQQNGVDIRSGKGWFRDGKKSLPELMLICNGLGDVTFIGKQFCM